jgi:hypothetical protein
MNTPKLVMLVTSPWTRSPTWSLLSSSARLPGAACAARSEKTTRPFSGSNSMILARIGWPIFRYITDCRSSSLVNEGTPIRWESGMNPRM